ncbi:hypothetical protein llg_11500 [Luteolibacter sp. LG18]|nr:hypothetical protein llg_11500 [Luteolibacter sp. LG18]
MNSTFGFGAAASRLAVANHRAEVIRKDMGRQMEHPILPLVLLRSIWKPLGETKNAAPADRDGV